MENIKKRNFKFTIAPWYDSDICTQSGNTIVRASDGTVVAEIIPPIRPSQEQQDVGEEERANLKLIQYSPDLVNKLEELEILFKELASGRLSIFNFNIKEEQAKINTLLNNIEII